jgi:hypothetical protein
MKYLSKYGKWLTIFLLVTIVLASSVLVSACRICFPTPTPIEEAYITPTSGPVGTPFTITDPQGRMESGDECLLYLEGTPPDSGTLVRNPVISQDGSTLTGTIPQIDPGNYYVTVRLPGGDPRFPDLTFDVNW